MTCGARLLLCALAFSCLLSFGLSAHPKCLDESGNPVDWWILLKANKDSSSSDPNIADGHAYAFYDANSRDEEFFLTGNDISSPQSGVGRTLMQIYSGKSKDDDGWLFYNDETPEKKKSTSHGHTKGVMYFNKGGGFWLVHSVPRFADESWTTEYQFPDAESIYGQSMFCLSFDSLKTLDSIAGQMLYTWPQIYDSNLPSSLAPTMDNFSELIDGTHIRTKPGCNTDELTTEGGQSFLYFAKSAEFGADLYADLVEPYIRGAMLIETWMRPYEPDCCTPDCSYDNVNVNTTRLESRSGGAAAEWVETQDHSKWAISESESNGWACVGDINRNKSQWTRGGGTVCIRLARVWKAFRKMIKAVDSC